jgi:hypothetical protein
MDRPNKADTNGRHKKAYSKPEIIRFPLRPEEAVLGTCKINLQTGPLSSSGCGTCKNAGS